jgi:hypothetical protein
MRESMKELNAKFFLCTYKTPQSPVILHIFILFLVLNAVVLHARSSFLVTLNPPSNNSHPKITNRSFHLNAAALWDSLPPNLRHFSSHSTSSQPNFNSPLIFLYPSVFLKKSNSSFSLLFSSSGSRPRLYLWTDLRNGPGFVASSHWHFGINHPHVTNCSFMLFNLLVSIG